MDKNKITNEIYNNVPAEFCIEILKMDIDEYEELSDKEIYNLIEVTVSQVRDDVLEMFISEYLQ